MAFASWKSAVCEAHRFWIGNCYCTRTVALRMADSRQAHTRDVSNAKACHSWISLKGKYSEWRKEHKIKCATVMHTWKWKRVQCWIHFSFDQFNEAHTQLHSINHGFMPLDAYAIWFLYFPCIVRTHTHTHRTIVFRIVWERWRYLALLPPPLRYLEIKCVENHTLFEMIEPKVPHTIFDHF